MTDQSDRSYQRMLIDEANAQMGRQRISRRELARITGIHRNTLDRLFQCERDMNVTQWDAIAHALGFEPGGLAARATQEVTVTPPKSEDPRVLLTWLLANPSRDEELNRRLSDAAASLDLPSSAQGQIRETIREVRRSELLNALAALPPSAAQGGNNHRSG